MQSPRWGYRLGSSVTPENWSKRIEPVGKKFLQAKITNLDLLNLFILIPLLFIEYGSKVAPILTFNLFSNIVVPAVILIGLRFNESAAML